MPTSAAAFARERTVALDMFASFGIVWEKVIKNAFCCENERTVLCSEKDSMNSLQFDRVLSSEL